MFEGETNALCGANVAYATAIVSAYVRNNTLQTDELPDLIRSVHGALMDLSRPPGEAARAAEACRAGQEVDLQGLPDLPGRRAEVQIPETPSQI
jgi:predicted transcriptional regulator